MLSTATGKRAWCPSPWDPNRVSQSSGLEGPREHCRTTKSWWIFEKYVTVNDVLYMQTPDSTYLFVPTCCHPFVLHLAHIVPWAGHMALQKTCAHISSRLIGPSMYTDVQTYCTTCHTCQKTSAVRWQDRAPLHICLSYLSFFNASPWTLWGYWKRAVWGSNTSWPSMTTQQGILRPSLFVPSLHPRSSTLSSSYSPEWEFLTKSSPIEGPTSCRGWWGYCTVSSRPSHTTHRPMDWWSAYSEAEEHSLQVSVWYWEGLEQVDTILAVRLQGGTASIIRLFSIWAPVWRARPRASGSPAEELEGPFVWGEDEGWEGTSCLHWSASSERWRPVIPRFIIESKKKLKKDAIKTHVFMCWSISDNNTSLFIFFSFIFFCCSCFLSQSFFADSGCTWVESNKIEGFHSI